ncbi:hypothetical protein ABG067_008411, partial [Albugo candida]
AAGQTIRFDRGHPTVEDDLAGAGVRILPIDGLDHGSIQFKVAVFNKAAAPVNIGVENISAQYGDTVFGCITKDQLAKKAKNRAMWTQIGLAMVAGAAAAAQNNNTYIDSYGRHGSYHTVIRRPGLSDGQLATIAAGGGGIALTQMALDKKLLELDDEIVQTTTLDPQDSYGGRVVLQKIEKAKAGDTVTLDID